MFYFKIHLILPLIMMMLAPAIVVFQTENHEGLKCAVCSSAIDPDCEKGKMEKFVMDCNNATYEAGLDFSYFNYEADPSKYKHNLSDEMATDLKDRKFRGLHTWQFSSNKKFEDIFKKNHQDANTRVPMALNKDRKLVCRKLVNRVPFSTPHNKKFKGRIIRMCGRMADDEQIGCQIHVFSARASTIICTCDQNELNGKPCNDANGPGPKIAIIFVIFVIGRILA